jgi:group II intron reverse transcriptase/maturase
MDVDLSNFFGSISHSKVLKIIREKIKDKRLLRYLFRMFKAGVLAEGELTVSDEGVPQGSVCSPVIANVFAHEVIDKWMLETVTKHCRGRVKMVRYADDLVICCQYDTDAQRIKIALAKRLEKFELKMNEDKTKLVKFSRARQNQGEAQGTFNFLGFTFYLGKDKRGRFYLVKMKTDGKRLRSKIKKVNEWARRNRNKAPLEQLMKIAAAKLRGHIQYYGISHNCAAVHKFRRQVTRILFRWMNRRSQRKSFDWEKFLKYLDRIDFPKAKIYHRLF